MNRIYHNLYHLDENLTNRARDAIVNKSKRRLAAADAQTSSEPRTSPLPLPYQLQVETLVAREHLPLLVNQGPRLVSLIESTKLKLTYAAWRVSGDTVTLCMNWDMGFDADLLTEAELLLPDIPEYAEFERLIIDEVKNIVVPVSMARRPAMTWLPNGELQCNLPLGDKYVYLRAEYQVAARDLAEFAALLEGALFPFAKTHGWYDGRTFIGITGRAGELVQNWLVPESGASLAAQRLASAPWNGLLRKEPVVSVLEPAGTDPVMAAFRKALSEDESASTDARERRSHVAEISSTQEVA